MPVKNLSLPAPLDTSENTVFLAPRSPELKPVEVTEEHCCCGEFVVEEEEDVEVKLEAEAAAAGTNPTAVPAAAATAAA